MNCNTSFLYLLDKGFFLTFFYILKVDMDDIWIKHTLVVKWTLIIGLTI